MRVEAIILLHTGLKPSKVSKMLDIPLNSVYYYNRQLTKGLKVIGGLT